MSNDKIINLETYEVLDDKKYIIVDNLIADTILILNKLGYKTKYSCSGHFFPIKKELFINKDLIFLEDIKKENINDIQKEIEKYNKILYEWASKLPKIS